MSIWAKWGRWAKWGDTSDGGSVLPTDIPAAEGAALVWLFNNLDGANWDNNSGWLTDPLAANWDGVTVTGGKVTVINLFSYWDNSLSGDISSFNIGAFTALTGFTIGGNSAVTGDISGWSLPATIEEFNLYYTGVSGDVSSFGPQTGMTYFALDHSSVTGSTDAWTVPASLIQLAINATALTGTPDFTSAAAIEDVLVDDCGLSQSEVDAYCLEIYTVRANITGTAPRMLIDDNATPSGIYQDGDPPTTGQEYIYELENDPETEGFTVWAITYDESWAITGTITDGTDAAAAVEGVTVTLTGDASDSTTTDSNGDYALSGLADGDYTVTPTKTNKDFIEESSAVEISGANVTGEDFKGYPEFEQPYVENFEGDTAGDNAATLEAKVTHNDVFGVACACRAIDYSTLPAIANGNLLTKCVADIGSNYAGQVMLLSAGEGFVPSDGEVFLSESVHFISGTSAQASISALSANGQEGIRGFFVGGTFRLDTITGGTPTNKKAFASGLASQPDGVCWFYFGLQYDLNGLGLFCRVIEFGSTGATQEDTGWVAAGAVSSPTYDANTEWLQFQAASNSSTSALQGMAQLRICEQTEHGYGLGQKATHNYRAP